MHDVSDRYWYVYFSSAATTGPPGNGTPPSLMADVSWENSFSAFPRNFAALSSFCKPYSAAGDKITEIDECFDAELNRAFSAPSICTVEAGYLARLVRLPAWEMSRALT